MRSKRLARFFIGSVLLPSLHSRHIVHGQNLDVNKLKLGGGSFTTSIAQANGIFAKYGLQVEIPRSAAGPTKLGAGSHRANWTWRTMVSTMPSPWSKTRVSMLFSLPLRTPRRPN